MIVRNSPAFTPNVRSTTASTPARSRLPAAAAAEGLRKRLNRQQRHYRSGRNSFVNALSASKDSMIPFSTRKSA